MPQASFPVTRPSTTSRVLHIFKTFRSFLPYLGVDWWGWGCSRRASAFNFPAVCGRHAVLSFAGPDGVDGRHPHVVRRAGGQEASVDLQQPERGEMK